MNLTLSKQRVITLAGAALLSLSMVVPALAVPNDPDQDVWVFGYVPATLSFEIDNGVIFFAGVDPLGTDNTISRSAVDTDGVSDGACYVADTSSTFAIKSNMPYEGHVTASETLGLDTAALGLDKLSRADPSFPDPLAYEHCLLAWDFAGGATLWTWGGSTALATVTHSYGVQVDLVDQAGEFNITLTYVVGQLFV